MPVSMKPPVERQWPEGLNERAAAEVSADNSQETRRRGAGARSNLSKMHAEIEHRMVMAALETPPTRAEVLRQRDRERRAILRAEFARERERTAEALERIAAALERIACK